MHDVPDIEKALDVLAEHLSALPIEAHLAGDKEIISFR